MVAECFNVFIACESVGVLLFFFFKQKTAYEMRISDWSSDVCSSDLHDRRQQLACAQMPPRKAEATELQGVAQPGCRSARGADCSKVLGIEAIVSLHRRLAVGQSKQCGALPLGHRNTCGHVSSFKNLLPFARLMKEDRTEDRLE